MPNCKPISFGRPGNVRYTTPSPHPTTPDIMIYNFGFGKLTLFNPRESSIRTCGSGSWQCQLTPRPVLSAPQSVSKAKCLDSTMDFATLKGINLLMLALIVVVQIMVVKIALSRFHRPQGVAIYFRRGEWKGNILLTQLLPNCYPINQMLPCLILSKLSTI